MTPKYQPADSMKSPRFAGVRTFARLPHVTTLESVDLAVVGVPFDTGGTYRVGARFGPESIRSASALLRPYNPALEVDVFDSISCIDFGDLDVVPGYLPEAHAQITEAAQPLFAADVVPIFLGGDHSVSLPLLRAAAAQHGPLALVHFDSHSDLWHGYYGGKDTHGTPFRRAVEEGLVDVDHSIQVGLRGSVYDAADARMTTEVGMELITGPELHAVGMAAATERIRARVEGVATYVTFDIDFVDPAFAPGTGTPEVGGFTGYESLQLVRGLRGLDIRSFDLVEVMPMYDPTGVTSLLAANLAHEFMALTALRS
ncbi:MAG: agmatinase [Acidobacteriota bacterium]